jgi:fission process protein 1
MSVHEEHDIFRHTPLRYLGYCNEVGEAFRYQLSFRALACTYVISTGYVIGDAIDKGYKAYKKYHFEEMKTHEKNLARNYVIKTTSLVSIMANCSNRSCTCIYYISSCKVIEKTTFKKY